MQAKALQLIARHLTDKAVDCPSRWAERYRVIKNQPWVWDKHPWLKAIHDDPASIIVNCKAAQMGLSETAVNRTFYTLDKGYDVLYLLPNSKPDATDFSAGRFDPAVSQSQYLQDLFVGTQNVGMKKTNKGSLLYVRGSRSDSSLKSVPVSLIVYDEYDEMGANVRSLASERGSGQDVRSEFFLSTPTVPQRGIDALFQTSDRKSYFFRCPRCGQLELLTQESLVITAERHTDPKINSSHYICKNTKLRLPDSKIEMLRDGVWVPETESLISGYHISQFYSNAAASDAVAIAKAYVEGEFNKFAKQEYYKNKRGEPYVEEGSTVTDKILTEVTGDYISYALNTTGLVTMGVDVGNKIHFEIIKDQGDHVQVLREGYVNNFEDLDHLMRSFNIIFVIIDAQPEKRKALEYARRFPGRVKVNYYIEGLSNTVPIKVDEDTLSVKTDRTFWIDQALGRFHNRTITIPRDTSEEYKEHVKALVRRYAEDGSSNVIARYISSGPDHLGHSRVYSEIALSILKNVSFSHDL